MGLKVAVVSFLSALVVGGATLQAPAAQVTEPVADHPDPANRLLIVPGVCIVYDSTLPHVADTPLRPVVCRAIRLNPALFYQIPGPLQAFTLSHELGHIFMGHTAETEPRSAEREADCVAARLIKAYWPEHLHQLIDYFVNYPEPSGSDVHDPWPARGALMARCAVTVPEPGG